MTTRPVRSSSPSNPPPDTIPFPPYSDVDGLQRSNTPAGFVPPYNFNASQDLPRANHHALEHLVYARQSSRTPPPPYSEYRHRTFSASSPQRRGMPSSTYGAPPRPDRSRAPNAHSRISSSYSPQRKLSPHRDQRLPPSPSSKSRHPPQPRRERTPSPSYASSTASRSPPRYSAEHNHPPTTEKFAHRPGLDDSDDDPFAHFRSPKDPHARISLPFPHARPGGPRRPLVDYIRNEWQHRTSSRHPAGPASHARARSDSNGSDDAYIVPASLRAYLSSRALRRYVVLGILLGVLGYVAWFRAYMPDLEFRNMVRVSMQARLERWQSSPPQRPRGWFGASAALRFQGMTNLRTLDPALVPGSGHPSTARRRLVIVGAIHGHAAPLQALLARVSFDPATDHLATTGEAIGRGPASAAVLDMLAAHNATLVRGPAEDRTLLAHRDLHAPALGISTRLPASRYAPRALDPPRSTTALAAALSDAHVAYLARSTPMLALGPVRGMAAGGVAVAHAGLVPYVPLARHDPGAAMTMRSLDLRAHVPSPRAAPPRDARPKQGARRWRDQRWQDELGRTVLVEWAVAWEAAQGLREKGERWGVVFGGKRVGVEGGGRMKWSWGLDGGCVEGGDLMALVIEGGRKVGNKVSTEVVGVPCEREMEEGWAVGDLGTS